MKISQTAGTLKRLITGEDSRLLVIAGPCSVDSPETLLTYVGAVERLAARYADKFFFIPRVFTVKPRTKDGFRGIYHSPDLKRADIEKGLFLQRGLHLSVAENFTPGADELLYPENFEYIDDAVSYFTIGARSSDNQSHREVASGLDVPVGVKNSLNGDLQALVNALSYIHSGHIYSSGRGVFESGGNSYAHAVLRGSIDSGGVHRKNYSELRLLRNSLISAGINTRILVDANHSNSSKTASMQFEVVRATLESPHEGLLGFMLESYLHPGSQGADTREGVSLTDECIGIDETAEIFEYIAANS